jgi:site-specific recombinase XerD
MIALIDLYQKELLKVNGFSPSTVETYTLNINAFCRFAENELQIDPVNVSGQQLLQWILYLKNTGIGYSRIENHHYALKSFFAFVKKTGIIDANPAEALPLLITRRRQVTKPISTKDAFKLLDSFDQSTWTGLRDYIIVSIFWALGLRTSELTGLEVRDFEFDQLLRYLAHTKSPRKKLSPLFPADTKKTAISNDRVQRIVKDQAKKTGIIAGVTPRVLRHSFATEMYHQNVPLSAIQAMMGHDSIADTSIYIHVSDKLKQLALDSILISRRSSWQ